MNVEPNLRHFFKPKLKLNFFSTESRSRIEILAKNEMREMAATTRETLKDIFDMVRQKHPAVAHREAIQ